MILILIAGSQKIFDPSTTSGALRAARMPHSIFLVRLLGAVEVGIAALFIAEGGTIPALLGAFLYAGFAWFVINALARDLPISSCGCLGAAETPPTMVHVVLNLIATGVMVGAAIIPIAPLGGLLGQEMKTVIPHLLFTGASVYLLYALLAVLPLVSKRAMASLPTFVATPRRPGE
jgi:phosphatidylglycerophosphate synthase